MNDDRESEAESEAEPAPPVAAAGERAGPEAIDDTLLLLLLS